MSQPNPPSILMENLWDKYAKNCYHAKLMNQRHFNNETYVMRLDSHHRFVKDWDTKCVQMLHSCDAGEYSVLTTYGRGYGKYINNDLPYEEWID